MLKQITVGYIIMFTHIMPDSIYSKTELNGTLLSNFATRFANWSLGNSNENKNLAIANRSRVSCAQYVEDIYRPKYYTVTLKYRLRVT